MSDLGPLPRCKVDKRGRHDLTYLFNDSPEGWLTMTCDRCGVMRRVPMCGDFARPLDDADAETIAYWVSG